jgi:signal transduction histidine kinase
LGDLVRETQISRLKIYNAQGIILYSTRQHEIGKADGDNPNFKNAMTGDVGSKLRLHDAFGIFSRSSVDDNLIETYAPIWLPGHVKPGGVFEIYTDISSLVWSMNHSELLIFVGIVVIMTGLYAMLLTVIRMAENIIAGQRAAIMQRNRTLERVALHTFRTDGTERRRVAFELQEQIAQTLGAVKFKVEAFAEEVAPSGSRARAIANDEIAPILQDSVCNLRDLASRIHPPVLDDFGLAASLRWLCQQVQEAEDRREVALAVTVLDDEVPEILNDVIYRIVQQTLSYLLLTPGSKDIQVALTGNDRIHLSMAFRIDDPHARGNLAGSTQSHLQQVTTYWERAILAGGVYEVSEARDGGFACQATWRNVVGD